MSVSYCKGKRGRSKKELQLSVDLMVGFGGLTFHVWEKVRNPKTGCVELKLTHTFYADEVFAQAVRQESQLYLDWLKREREKDAARNAS